MDFTKCEEYMDDLFNMMDQARDNNAVNLYEKLRCEYLGVTNTLHNLGLDFFEGDMGKIGIYQKIK